MVVEFQLRQSAGNCFRLGGTFLSASNQGGSLVPAADRLSNFLIGIVHPVRVPPLTEK